MGLVRLVVVLLLDLSWGRYSHRQMKMDPQGVGGVVNKVEGTAISTQPPLWLLAKDRLASLCVLVCLLRKMLIFLIPWLHVFSYTNRC